MAVADSLVILACVLLGIVVSTWGNRTDRIVAGIVLLAVWGITWYWGCV